MIIVSDSSPLIALLSVDRIELLEQLFGTVFIPPAVRDEVFGSTGHNDVMPGFIQVQPPPAANSVRFLKMSLHIGESEAIALAIEWNAGGIILDDKLARETADRLGLHVIGTIGVLLLAKKKGLLREIRPLIIQMIDRISFRIAPAVINRALDLLQEPSL